MKRRSTKLVWTAFGLLIGMISLLPAHGRYVYLLTEDWRMPAALLLVLAVVFVILRGRRAFDRRDWPVWCFAAALGAGLVNAIHHELALRVYGHMVLVLVACYFAGKSSISTPEVRRGLFVTIAGFAAMVAIYGLVESAAGANPLYEGFWENPYYDRYVRQGRPVSTQFNPAALGTFLLLSCPFAAVLIGDDRRWARILGISSLVTSASCLFLTFSRAALLGLVVMVAVWLVLRGRIRALGVGFAAIVLLIGFASYLPYPVSKYGLQGLVGSAGGMTSFKERIVLRMTVAALREHPWLGLGHVGFRLRFDEFYPEHAPEPYFETTDNSYLTLLAETGLAGGSALAIFLGLLMSGAASACRVADGAERAIAEAVLVALVGLLVNAAGYEAFYWTGPWMYSCLVFGFAAGLTGVAGRASSAYR